MLPDDHLCRQVSRADDGRRRNPVVSQAGHKRSEHSSVGDSGCWSSSYCNSLKFCEQCGSPLDGRRTAFCDSSCRSAFKRAEIRAEFIQAYGGKCQCPGGCDVTEPEFLSLGHVFNDGAQHRRATGVRGYAMYRLIAEEGYPKDRYRLECHNCNMARAHFGRCPHELKPKSEGSQ